MSEQILKVKRKSDGKIFSVMPQIVDLNFKNEYCLRYNIGINGYNEWTFIEAIYDNEDFNARYEVIE